MYRGYLEYFRVLRNQWLAIHKSLIIQNNPADALWLGTWAQLFKPYTLLRNSVGFRKAEYSGWRQWFNKFNLIKTRSWLEAFGDRHLLRYLYLLTRIFPPQFQFQGILILTILNRFIFAAKGGLKNCCYNYVFI